MKDLIRPLMIYDGDCDFCCRWVWKWKHVTQNEVDYVPYQEVRFKFPEISDADFDRSIHFIERNGRHTPGAEGVFRALAYNQNWSWCLTIYQKAPGFSAIAEWVYRLVSQNRHWISKFFSWLSGPPDRPSHVFTGDLFLRSMGLVYFIAFLSLGSQILGLVGSQGISPAYRLFELILEQKVDYPYWQFPTVFWLVVGDGFLQGACWFGAVLGILGIAGFAPGFIWVLMWGLYLSLMTVSPVFLSYQWDTLLLETGFLTIFLAPNFWSFQRSSRNPSLVIILLFRLLLFKFMFLAGLAKIVGNDPNWHNLKALNFHFETQPLPTWIGWYMHQLSEASHQINVLGVFLIQVGMPILIFASRPYKIFYLLSNLGFQVIIFLTGNYGFFNLLTMFLLIPILDDAFWKSVFPQVLVKWIDTEITLDEDSSLRKMVFRIVAVFLIFFHISNFASMFSGRKGFPSLFLEPLKWTRPWHLSNRYGLFAVMTTTRPEIIIEGSNDLKEWKTYGFKWKAGDLYRAPAFVAPHQPRLDWQMWFAALGKYEGNVWFTSFLMHLLKGSETVISLLGFNPFEEEPPRYVRAVLYKYQFTSLSERSATGRWWRRIYLGAYSPILRKPSS